MILILVAFLGGALTILSPCILPVLPFVFAKAERPFLKNGLPLLLGMAMTFAGVATLAAVGGSWATQLNQYGRLIALFVLALFAVTLLSRTLADRLTRPLVALGNRLTEASDEKGGATGSFLLGIAVGFLWAPCAGPILGLVLTGAAISGPSTHTTLLLLAYASGAAFSLALATLAGGRVFAAMKRSLGVNEWIRRGLGTAILLAVVAITFGWDTGVLTQLSSASTNRLEQALLDKFPATASAVTRAGNENVQGGAMTAGGAMTGNTAMMAGNAMMGRPHPEGLPMEGTFPSLDGATSWVNSSPLTPDALRGKVVMIDFWTYSCINCLRAIPYVNAWYNKYKDFGLVVLGIHTPEFAFEKSEKNVSRAIADLGITYPVALDSDYSIWRAFNNQYWPAHYFIDSTGSIRGHHFGEGSYEESEQIIRKLLTEAGVTDLPGEGTEAMNATGVQEAPDQDNVQSPETYIGHERAESFISDGGLVNDTPDTYTLPADPGLNQWGLGGNWTVDDEKGTLNSTSGQIVFRFYARDLHLVLGPGPDGLPIPFRVLLDGAPPGDSHGLDIDQAGNGVVEEERLYQLIRQPGAIDEHTFTIEFLDKGVQAYSFTFG